MIVLHFIYGVVILINIIQVVLFVRKRLANKKSISTDLSATK